MAKEWPISTLIARLQEIKAAYGDVKVAFDSIFKHETSRGDGTYELVRFELFNNDQHQAAADRIVQLERDLEAANKRIKELEAY